MMAPGQLNIKTLNLLTCSIRVRNNPKYQASFCRVFATMSKKWRKAIFTDWPTRGRPCLQHFASDGSPWSPWSQRTLSLSIRCPLQYICASCLSVCLFVVIRLSWLWPISQTSMVYPVRTKHLYIHTICAMLNQRRRLPNMTSQWTSDSCFLIQAQYVGPKVTQFRLTSQT